MTLRVCLNRSIFLLFSLSREVSPFRLHEHVLSLLVSKLFITSLHSLYKFHVSCFVHEGVLCTAVVLFCFFAYSFVYLFIYYSLNIFSLCVFVYNCLFTTTLISSYFSAWPSHSARLAFAISEWLCSLSFTIISF